MTDPIKLISEARQRAEADASLSSDDFGHDCQKLLEAESDRLRVHCNETIPALCDAIEAALNELARYKKALEYVDLNLYKMAAPYAQETHEGIKAILEGKEG